MMTNYVQESADAVKLGVATSPATLSLFGYPMADWGYVLSAIVSIMFIVEKAPVFIARLKQFKRWIKREPKQ